jgi:hypothetical protein
MKKTVNFYEFSRWFEQHRPNNFSRAGLRSLYDYIEEIEADCGKEIEFDPIALCVEYTEYDDIDEFHLDYDKDKYPTLDDLRDYTQVIEIGMGSFIILNF